MKIVFVVRAFDSVNSEVWQLESESKCRFQCEFGIYRAEKSTSVTLLKCFYRNLMVS